MAIRPVLKMGHPLLRQVALPVTAFGTRELLELVRDMDDSMRALNGARLAAPRGDAHQRAACAKVIVAAFEVDPILAAEMIFRSTEEVWTQFASTIQGFVARWHAPGKVDRAFRFMLTSGRPEFSDKVWPLIADENQQISLEALRNCRRFRPSFIGKDAERKIKALSRRARMVLLSEMAWHSGMDGLDLASAIAMDEPDPEVQASVVDALAFRRADHHMALVLRQASDKTFDLVSQKGLADEVDDEQVVLAIGGPWGARIRPVAGDFGLSFGLSFRFLMH